MGHAPKPHRTPYPLCRYEERKTATVDEAESEALAKARAGRCGRPLGESLAEERAEGRRRAAGRGMNRPRDVSELIKEDLAVC